MDGDFLFFLDVLLFQRVLFGCLLRAIIHGQVGMPFGTPQVVDGQVAADGVQPGFEGAFSLVLGLLGAQQDEDILGQFFGYENVADITVEIKDQTVAIGIDDLRKAAFVPFFSETAVATCTVIHRRSPFQKDFSLCPFTYYTTDMEETSHFFLKKLRKSSF